MIQLPQSARDIITILENAGFKAYAVGGSVRDTLMGRVTRGWDFTTNAVPENILKLFPDSFYDNEFGTVGIKIRDASWHQGSKVSEQDKKPDDIYEITPYRKEGRYSDHRHPDTLAWGKTIEEDLRRRDFTVNAIAFDGKTVIDPYGGQKDIEQKLIRAVGDASARFNEDALRMMRAVRIASQLGFFIDEQTSKAIRTNTKLLSTISNERIHDELIKLLASPYPADGILLLKSTGLLKIILPEFDSAFAVPQKSPKRHHIYDVGTHSVEALRHCPSDDPIVRFATLIHDIGKPPTFQKGPDGLITFFNHEVVGSRLTKNILYRLKFSKKDIDRIWTLVRWHQFTVDERQTDSAIRRFIRRVGKENLEDMLALRIGDRLGGGALETSWRLELFKKRLEEVQKQPFTVADLTIDGFDVMKEFDCKPGPLIGKILNALFDEVEKGTLANERKSLLTRMVELKSSGKFSPH